MKTLTLRFSLLLMLAGWLLFPFGSQNVNAQDNSSEKKQNPGKISGTVVDAKSGETLIGVNVIVKGTTKGAATDVDGNYSIGGLEPGLYTIKATYLSYADYTVRDVKVKSGKSTTVDIALKQETKSLDEVTVTARVNENNEAALLSKRQKSISFSNAISAESISSTGSGNAAEAMKKVTGATVVDGKYVYVRGLGDRYSETQLNGSNLPSADPDKKSFQMDLFPSSLIKNITTVKTFTPDRPGNFTGGLVNVETKDFPDRFTFEFSASRSYNTQTSFEKILLGNSSNTDFLGFDGGARSMPDAVSRYVGNPDLQLPQRNASMENADELAALSKSFNQTMAPLNADIGMNQSYSASVGNLIKFNGNDLGYTASLTYDKSYSSYNNGRVARWAGGSQADSLFSRINLQDRKGSENVDIGGLLNLSYRWNTNNKISSTYIRTQSGTSTGRFLQGSYPKDLSDRALFNSQTIHYVERSLSSYQLEGKHYLAKVLNSTINWNASYAKNTQDEPDLRYVWNVRSYLPAFNDSVYSMPMNNVSSPPSRFFRDLDERTFNTGVDISIPFPTKTATKGKIKFGGNYTNVDRSFRESRIEYQLPENGAVDLNDVNGDINAYFNHVGLIQTENGPKYGLTIDDATALRNNYDVSKELYALYGMIEMPIVDRLKFSGGIRMEDADISTISQDSSVARGILNNTDFLPSLNLTYNITDKMNARASYTRTLARPTFRELAPYVTFKFVGDYLFSGNADLKRTLITNYDVRWEWFPNPGEIFSVSGFYKEFKNPLERVIRIDIGNNASSIQNVDRGVVYGVEFEARKRLDFLGGFMRDFLVSTNFTLVESRVDVPRLELVEILNMNTQELSEEEVDRVIANAPSDVKHRPLSNQSPYSFNFDISYENPEVGMSAAVNYHLFGDRLTEVMRGATPNSYQRSYGSLNFVGSKSITDRLTLNVSIDNILNPDIRETQYFRGIHYVNQSYQKGITYKFGLKYSL
mgnify:CR=1 FL=1